VHPLPRHPAPEDIAALERILSAALEPMAEVRSLHLLTDDQRTRIAALEREAEENGAAGGIMPFDNEGVGEVLAADMVFAALTGPMVGVPPRPWTLMLDDDDQVVGEWLPPQRIEEVRAGGRCIFLSSDFVMYKDRRPRGRGRFVMPYMPLELPDHDPTAPMAGRRVGLCGVGCPSPPADTYIRSLWGDPGSEVATLILGACWAEQSPQGESPHD
jgi:hypothetical protein